MGKNIKHTNKIVMCFACLLTPITHVFCKNNIVWYPTNVAARALIAAILLVMYYWVIYGIMNLCLKHFSNKTLTK